MFEARKATNLTRFGVENPFAAEECKQKMRATWLEKYGIEHGPSTPEAREKAHQTSVERYGDNPIASDVIQKRIKATMFERHGVERPMQMLSVREALVSGSLAKYGTAYPMQNKAVMDAALEKRFETVSRQGDHVYSSKPEMVLHGMLVERFGASEVRVQQRLNRKWSVDFYVKLIDTYVQFDGVYWHGLDRPIEEIRTSSKPRDQVIYAKWAKDRELDAYAREHSLRLIRVTDVEFKADPQTCLLKIENDRCPASTSPRGNSASSLT